MHAVLQFDSPCVGELAYEGTVMAIAMAGAFISFLVDYMGLQYLKLFRERRGSPIPEEGRTRPSATYREKHSTTVARVENVESSQLMALQNHNEEERLSVIIMEGGIIFHSICESI